MTTRTRLMLAASTAIALVAVPRPALAGPPLICHPYDIGTAASLPWGDGPGWLDASANYDVANLVGDTEALLGPSTPVIVRMETLRRASIYASRDARIAAALVARLTAKTRLSEAGGHPDPLALLDAAYVTEALRQIADIGGIAPYRDHAAGIRDVIAHADGLALMTASLRARPGDPSLEFAAAIIAAGRDRAAYAEHARRARDGAAQDALLARNLSHIS